MKKILITGGTGFIGEKLCFELFRLGYELTLLTRNPKRAADKLALPYSFVQWDGKSALSPDLVDGAFAVIHLAGESVASQRWSPEVKRAIHDSRCESTKRLAEAIDRAQKKPEVFLGASATGIYGDRGSEALTEASALGADFLAEVCRDWEKSYTCSAKRIVLFRTGVVWGVNGGALAKMLPAFRLGLAGRLGNGKQWVSWIHLEDLLRLYLHALENPQLSGVVNAVAPNAATNLELTQTLALTLRRPALFPMPAFALRLALGEMASVLLSSQRVFPEVAEKMGFQFKYPDLTSALNEILSPLGKTGAYVFEAALWLMEKRTDLFTFFSAAENLEKITPPWLRFRVVSKSTETIQEGTLIDYRLRIKGIPIGWRTRIEKWCPEESFVDRQLKGPYKDWHHTHEFKEVRGGTLMTDRVVYQLPFGILGDIAHFLLVKRDVKTIFAYRKSVVANIRISGEALIPPKKVL